MEAFRSRTVLDTLGSSIIFKDNPIEKGKRERDRKKVFLEVACEIKSLSRPLSVSFLYSYLAELQPFTKGETLEGQKLKHERHYIASATPPPPFDYTA